METEAGPVEFLLEFMQTRVGRSLMATTLSFALMSMFYFVRDSLKSQGNNTNKVVLKLKDVEARGVIGKTKRKVKGKGLFSITDKIISFKLDKQSEIIIPLQAIHDVKTAEKPDGKSKEMVLKVQFYDREAAPSEIHWLVPQKDMDKIWQALGR